MFTVHKNETKIRKRDAFLESFLANYFPFENLLQTNYLSGHRTKNRTDGRPTIVFFSTPFRCACVKVKFKWIVHLSWATSAISYEQDAASFEWSLRKGWFTEISCHCIACNIRIQALWWTIWKETTFSTNWKANSNWLHFYVYEAFSSVVFVL